MVTFVKAKLINRNKFIKPNPWKPPLVRMGFFSFLLTGQTSQLSHKYLSQTFSDHRWHHTSSFTPLQAPIFPKVWKKLNNFCQNKKKRKREFPFVWCHSFEQSETFVTVKTKHPVKSINTKVVWEKTLKRLKDWSQHLRVQSSVRRGRMLSWRHAKTHSYTSQYMCMLPLKRLMLSSYN